MLKKWFADYKSKLRPEGMKNCNVAAFITLFIKFQTWHISEIHNFVENMKCRPTLYIDNYLLILY